MTRIVFVGSPGFAVPSLRAVNEMYGVVGIVTQPDRPAGRGRALRQPAVKLEAARLQLPVFQPEKVSSPDSLERLTAWAPELIIVAAFGQLLRPAILNLPQHGCLNVHASLLPRWRGATPIQAAIAAGDSTTGVTIMRMDEGLDTGPVLAQRPIPILDDDTGGTLGARLAVLGGAALRESLPAYLAGKLAPQPQDSSKATKAPLLRKQDGLLDLGMPADELARRVRAYNPWPGAHVAIDGAALKILRARGSASTMPVGTRGVLERQPVLGTAEGALVLEEVQPAGKKPMSGEQFLLGARNWSS